MQKLTANILFSGIGAQERGFMDSGLFDVEILSTSDIDKDAVVSYAAIHCGLTPKLIETYNYPSKEEMVSYLEKINLGYNPKKKEPYNWNRIKNRKGMPLEKYYLSSILSKNLGDISRIEKLPAADLWTISFPCQSISIAGRMKGLKPDSGTRSSLLWENIRLLKVAKENDTMPQYLMFENVKNLVGSKFIHDFEDLISVLDELGYNTYWKVLNGKECGIPQNRERLFAFCFRKDIDKHCFTFPKPFDIGIRLKDLLDDSVDSRYYINTDKAAKLIKNILEKEGVISDAIEVDLSLDNPCMTGTGIIESANKVKQIGGLTESVNRKNPSANRVYDATGISPALVTSSGGGHEPRIIERKILQLGRGFDKGGVHSNCPAITCNSFQENNYVLETLNQQMVAMRGRYVKDSETNKTVQQLEKNNKDVSNTITTVQKDSFILEERQYGVYLNASDRFFRPPLENVSRCLKASQHDAGVIERIAIGNEVLMIGALNSSQDGKVVSDEGVAFAHTAGHCNQPKVLVKEIKSGIVECYSDKGIIYQYRIRKLTPKETFLLMGFNVADVEKCYKVAMSDTQLYHQTGNSIITNCCELLAEHLYKAQYDSSFVCKDKRILESQSEAQLSLF